MSVVRSDADTLQAGTIVEVEAYLGPADAGSHAYRGETPRVRTMFGPPGHLYVYFTYGMHWCANVVCGPGREPGAVLLRALAPTHGLDEMRGRRGPAARRDRDLCSGPAKLCEALGIDAAFDGADLVTGAEGVWVAAGQHGLVASERIVNTRRIGLSKGQEHPWRWFVHGDPNVSRGPIALSSEGGAGA